MGFLEKYYKGIERGESTTEWRAIELADKEVDELWKAINKLRKRVTYDEADEARLEERVDELEKEIKALKADRDELQNDVDNLNERVGDNEDAIVSIEERLDNIETGGNIDGEEEDI